MGAGATLARGLGGGLLAVALFAVTGELALRVIDPQPRLQVVRPKEHGKAGLGHFGERAGHVVWTHEDSELRQDPGCGPDAANVLMLGSSIFWGTSYTHDQVVSHFLQQRLDPSREAVCVRNWAQPAYVGGNKMAELRALAPELEPAVVVWEVWASDPSSFTMIDGVAYNLSRTPVDEDGFPVLFPALPSALHHALFRHSKLWWYAHLALAEESAASYDTMWREHLDHRMPEVLSIARSTGELLLVFAAELDAPFAEHFEEQQRKKRGYWWTREWAQARAVPLVDVADSWREVDVASVRHDPCCHLNPAGHERLADLLAPEIRRILDARAPAEPAP